MSKAAPYMHRLNETCCDTGTECGREHDPMPLGSADSPLVHALAHALEDPELLADLYWLTEGSANDATRNSVLAEVARHLAAVCEAEK